MVTERSPSPPLNVGTSYLMTLGAVTHTMAKGLSRGKSSAVNFYSGKFTNVTCGTREFIYHG